MRPANAWSLGLICIQLLSSRRTQLIAAQVPRRWSTRFGEKPTN
jgi:hypothetical protein